MEVSLNFFLVLCQLAFAISTDWFNSDRNDLKNHNCPRGVPLWINSKILSSTDTFEPECLQSWYSGSSCHVCNGDQSEWLYGIQCQTGNKTISNCALTCCISKSLKLSGCKWATLKALKSASPKNKLLKNIRWNSLPTSVEVCSYVHTQLLNKSEPIHLKQRLKDEAEPDETVTTPVEIESPTARTLPPLPSQPREKTSGDRLKFHCDGDSIPARVNGKNLRHKNGLFCGKAYPCTKSCYEDVSCTMGKKRNDFISGYNCVAEDSDDEPYKCKMTCCTSPLVELHDCTWHYPTDRSVTKRNNSELVLRRIEFFPYILEVCAVKKLDKPAKSENVTLCAWSQYIDPGIQQPVQVQPNGVENSAGQSASQSAAQSASNAAGQSAAANAAEASQSASAAASSAAATKAALVAGGCSPLDMVFVVDSSHSLLSSGFLNELSLITTIMAYFDYSTTATALLQSRMGVVTFGNSAVQSVGLTTYSTSATANSQLLTAVNSLAYLDSTGTDIIGGVESATSMYSSTAAISGVRRVTILITDGSPTVPSGLTTSQYQSLFSTAANNLLSVTGEEIYAVAATAEGQILTSNFGISASHTSYTDVSSGFPGLAATVVGQICTPTVITTTTTAPTTTTTTTTPTTTTSSTTLTTSTTVTTSTTSTSTTSTSTTSTTTTICSGQGGTCPTAGITGLIYTGCCQTATMKMSCAQNPPSTGPNECNCNPSGGSCGPNLFTCCTGATCVSGNCPLSNSGEFCSVPSTTGECVGGTTCGANYLCP